MQKYLKMGVLSMGLLGFISPVFAQTSEKTTCYIFKANKFLGKKPCTIIDYQTLGDAYTLDYKIAGMGKFSSYGGIDHNTLKDYAMFGKKPAKHLHRLRSNYQIVKEPENPLSLDDKYLSCVRQIKGIEVCTQ